MAGSRRKKNDLYGYAGTSAMGEVWLILNADAQFILEGREEAQQTGKKKCLIFSCLASKCEFLFY